MSPFQPLFVSLFTACFLPLIHAHLHTRLTLKVHAVLSIQVLARRKGRLLTRRTILKSYLFETEPTAMSQVIQKIINKVGSAQ